MTVPPSTEFWIGMLFVVVFFLFVFLFFIVRKINRIEEFGGSGVEMETGTGNDVSDRILETLTPLLEESRKTAVLFEEQIIEKKRLIKELNEALDSRIISLNLQLSRADAQLKKTQEQLLSVSSPSAISFEPQHGGMSNPVEGDQVEQILGLYDRNMDMDTIAQKLSVPKGEVALVIELKKKCVAMEKSGP